MQALIVATCIWVSYCEEFFGCEHTTADSRRAKMLGPTNERRSLSMDVKDIRKPTYPLQRASSTQGFSKPTSLANTPLMTPPFLTPPRRTQSTGSTTFDQLHGRHISMKKVEALDPIFDSTEIFQLNSQISPTIEESEDLMTQEPRPSRPSTPEEKHKKRSQSIKKLCSSFKRSESGLTSP